MIDEQKKNKFTMFMLPHARAALGHNNPSFAQWAIGKAGRECNWNTENALITMANNALGIKAVPGVPSVMMRANTGSEAGEVIAWRQFPDLESCFIEFANMINFRDYWDDLRVEVVRKFEEIYVNGDVKGHANAIIENCKDVMILLEKNRVVDHRGRFIPQRVG